MIDVFICTYNPDPAYLRRTVDGILSQDLSRDSFNFTIIDNNSKSSVDGIDFVKELGINVVVEKKQGLTAARGCAAAIARGEILVFVDDDLVIEKNYLSTVLNVFKNDKIGIVSGGIYPEYAQQPKPWFYRFEGMLAIRKINAADEFLENKDTVFNELFPLGAGMCIRAELLKEYYDTHLATENYIEGRKGDELSSSEDLDLDFYAIYKGYAIGVCPALKSTHLIPESRLSVDYLRRLAFYSLKSNYQLNEKWLPVFNKDVFTFFNQNSIKLFIRMVLHKILSFKKSHYLRYWHFRNLLELKK